MTIETKNPGKEFASGADKVWVVSPRTRTLISSEGSVLATVTFNNPDTTWYWDGVGYSSKEAALKAAEDSLTPSTTQTRKTPNRVYHTGPLGVGMNAGDIVKDSQGREYTVNRVGLVNSRLKPNFFDATLEVRSSDGTMKLPNSELTVVYIAAKNRPQDVESFKADYKKTNGKRISTSVATEMMDAQYNAA